MQVIKQFIEMMERSYKSDNADYNLCKENKCIDWCLHENRGAIETYKLIMESHEYQALKALIEPEEKPMYCKDEFSHRRGLMEERYCTTCKRKIVVQLQKCEKKLEAKRQTLLEYMDKISGYMGELLPKTSFERREIYKNISEYLEVNK